MRKFIYIVILSTIIIGLIGCKSKLIYVPVESSHNETEHYDKWVIDSIYLHDSIFVDRWQQGDTIYINKEVYQYVYKDKYVRDSIYITDSIKVEIPYPVEIIKEVNNQNIIQKILQALGLLFLGFIGFRIYKLFK